MHALFNYFLCFSNILLSCITIFAQEQQPPDSLAFQKLSSACSKVIPVAYDELQTDAKTSAYQSLSHSHFNKGIISDPLLLTQGHISGTQVYNRGSDPNQASIFRVRGLSRIAQASTPFIILDGIPGASLKIIDPNNIESITVLKDAFAQAMYGMRSANGVIVIQSKQNNFEKDTLRFSYQGQLGTSIVDTKLFSFSAEEFVADGGQDLGAANQWQNEIVRNSISQTHGLLVYGRKSNTKFSLSGNFRNVHGILKNSGFEQYNVFGKIDRKFVDNKLHLRILSSFTDRSSNLGISEVFRQAILFNPTAPILAQDAPFPFNTEQYGGYFETVGLFRSYNPLAIADLNQRTGKNTDFISSAHLSYQANQNLVAHFRFTRQESFENRRAFYSPFSNYFGNAAATMNSSKGQGELLDIDNNFSLYEAFLTHKKSAKGLETQFTLGTAFHDGRYVETSLQIFGFDNLEAIGAKRFENTGILTDNSDRFESVNNAWNDDILSFFGTAHINLKDKIYLNTNLRFDGTSKLRNETSRGIFPAISLGFDLKNIANLQSMEIVNARISYGVTGGIPQEGGLSRRKVRTIQNADGTVVERTIHNGNPLLTYEKKKEVNLGFDFGIGKFTASIDAYRKYFLDGIGEVFNTEGLRFENLYNFNSQGIDLAIQSKILESSATSVSMGLQVSTYQTRAQDVPNGLEVVSFPGGVFQEAIIVLENEENVGSIYAPEFNGNISEEGIPIFTDINQDGAVITAPSLFDPNGDFVNLGTGTPSMELSWLTQIEYNGWQCYANVRGAFGHLLVNRTRLQHEPNSIFSNVYNRVETELAEPELTIASYSSLYVEKANFIKLDNLSFAKQIQMFGKKQLVVSLTAQNLITLSSYTGNDPEPALEDTPSIFINSELDSYKNNLPTVAGIDRRDSYLPSKTFTFGIQIRF